METSRISIFPLLYNYRIKKIKKNKSKTCGTIREDFNADSNKTLISVCNLNLDLKSNGHLVPLLNSVTFELYNCLMIRSYSFQVIGSL